MKRPCTGLALAILLALATLILMGCASGSRATPTLTGEQLGDMYYQKMLDQQRNEAAKEQLAQWELDKRIAQDMEALANLPPWMAVCNTGGDGVMLRSDPGCQNKSSSGLSDGTNVEPQGETASGCMAVRTSGGAEGYVPSQYLCSSPEPRPSACRIKGNVQFDTGEQIYHVPGQKYYDSTIVNPAYGERWFCTEAEAVAAGWRKSKE